MFKHLLIPSDGSELGTRAVHAGIDFARSIGAAVTVITVSEPFHLMTGSETAKVLTHATIPVLAYR
jgi:nucleotide-binding universal stress UspA family protein